MKMMKVIAQFCLMFVVMLTACASSEALQLSSGKAVPYKGDWCSESGKKECLPRVCSRSKPTLLLFSATWCGYCKKLAKEIISKPEVQEVLKNFNLVYINIDKAGGVKAAYKVEGVPTTIIVGEKCKFKAGVVGMPPSPDAYIQFLKRHIP